MNVRKKMWLVLVVAVIVAVTIACSCDTSSLTGGGGTSSEAIPGLAGKWKDPETLNVFTVAWQNGKYTVTDCLADSGDHYPITDQSWDGSKLTWKYQATWSGVYVSFETISVSGSSLYTNWWNDQGASGTETLTRP